MDILTQKVLVINRNWQGYEEEIVSEALCNLYRGTSTAIDTGSSPHRAVTWDEWVTLPIREGDRAIQTLHGPVRIPTVICKAKYADMPKPGVRDDEVLPAISPLGYPTPKRTVTDALIRWTAGSRHRRPPSPSRH